MTENVKTVICSYCHKEVETKYKFCPKCGKSIVPLKEFSCKCDGFKETHPLDEEHHYCPNCGKPAVQCLKDMLQRKKLSKRAFTGHVPKVNAADKISMEFEEQDMVLALLKNAKESADKIFSDRIQNDPEGFVPIYIKPEYEKAYLNDEKISAALHQKFHCWGFGKNKDNDETGVIYYKDISLKNAKEILAFYLGKNVSEFKGDLEIDDIPNFESKYEAFKKRIGNVVNKPKPQRDFDIESSDDDEINDL